MSSALNDESFRCTFCDVNLDDRQSFCAHSERCLTDIDDLLLVTYKRDGGQKPVNGIYRHNIYPNHTTVEAMVDSIDNELVSKMFNCDECDWSSNSVTHFKDHKKVRHRGELFQCDECDRTFMCRSNLRVHKKIEHSDGKYEVKCDECEKSFKHKSLLRRHKSAVHNTNRTQIPCKNEDCDATFLSFGARRLHVQREHEGSVMEDCPHCLKSFSKFYLKRHILVLHRTDECKFACSVCDKKFASAGELKRHEVIHSATELVKCDQCNRSMSERHLQKHMENMHFRSEQYFPCLCARVFGSMTARRDHQRVSCKKYQQQANTNQDEQPGEPEHPSFIHTTQSPTAESLQPCAQCNDQFSSKRSLQRHISDVHTVKEFSCSFCAKLFTTPLSLRRHERCMHHVDGSIPCKTCGKEFGCKQKLKGHVEAVHEKLINFQCDICPLGFYLRNNYRRHLRTHDKIKQFKCELCEKKFIHRAGLLHHRRQLHSQYFKLIKENKISEVH